MAQAEKFPQWLCYACAEKLESTYDFVLQARRTHELWLQKIGDSLNGDDEMEGTAALECLRETPIHLFEIEGVTIKTEELASTQQAPKADPLVRPRIVKRSIVHFSDSDEDLDDVPLRQRKIAASVCGSDTTKENVCELCNKVFRYVTNLYRHKQRDHGILGKNGEEYDTTLC